MCYSVVVSISEDVIRNKMHFFPLSYCIIQFTNELAHTGLWFPFRLWPKRLDHKQETMTVSCHKSMVKKMYLRLRIRLRRYGRLALINAYFFFFLRGHLFWLLRFISLDFFVNFSFDNNDSNPIICGCYLVEVVIYSK